MPLRVAVARWYIVEIRTVHRNADIFFRKLVEGFCASLGSIRVRAGRAGERGGRWRTSRRTPRWDGI